MPLLRSGLELAPAESHKLNHAGSFPASATTFRFSNHGECTCLLSRIEPSSILGIGALKSWYKNITIERTYRAQPHNIHLGTGAYACSVHSRFSRADNSLIRCPYRLTARTSDFQSANIDSTSVRGTSHSQGDQQ